MRRPEQGGSDGGSGTIWVMALSMVLIGLVCAVALVGLAQTARHQATAAADLAALAGAQSALEDPAAACAVAARIATANGAALSGCALDGEVVSVEVTVQVRLGSYGVGTAVARARAGPTDTMAVNP